MMPGDFEETLPPTELIPEHLLVEWTARLRGGETGAKADGLARYIIHDFCLRIWRNEAQSNITLHWIADVLTNILDDGKPEARKAFSLLPRANHRNKNVDLPLEITAWIKETMLRGYTLVEAKKLAAARFHRDFKSIGRDIDGLMDYPSLYRRGREIEEVFKQKGRPLPAAINGTDKK